MSETLLLIQTIALLCGGMHGTAAAFANERAEKCQITLLKCSRERCSKKKCQDRAVTLEKCVLGSIE